VSGSKVARQEHAWRCYALFGFAFLFRYGDLWLSVRAYAGPEKRGQPLRVDEDPAFSNAHKAIRR